MNSKTFFFLGGGILGLVLLISLIAWMMSGISGKVHDRFNYIEDTVKNKTNNYNNRKTTILGVVKSNKEAIGPMAAEWEKKLTAADARVAASVGAVKKSKELLEKNDGDDEPVVLGLYDQAQTEINGALRDIEGVSKKAAVVKQYFDNKKDMIGNARNSAKHAQRTEVEEKVKKASADWPAKASDLSRRLASIKEAQQAIATEAAKLKDDGSAMDNINAINKINSLRASIDEQQKTVSSLIPQLYRSWDKMLVDMDFREKGWNMEYYHTYKIGTITIDQSTGSQSFKESSKTERVSEAFFTQNENNFGMVLASKPAGKYDHEVDRVVQPPMYNKVAPRGQSNRYGQWRDDSWHWNEFMMGAIVGNMLSSSHSTIYYDDYRGYRSYRDNYTSSSRPYYGRSKTGESLYGSKGTATKQTKTLGNAWKKNSNVTQRRTQQKKSLQTRHTQHKQLQARRQAAARARARASSGSRSGGGK